MAEQFEGDEVMHMDEQANAPQDGGLFSDGEAQDIAQSAPQEVQELSAVQSTLRRISNAVQTSSAGGAQDWSRLYTICPEVRPDALPQQVFEWVADGMTPVEAYQKHMIAQSQIAAAAQKSRARAIGGVQSDAGQKENDPFLSGLNE